MANHNKQELARERSEEKKRQIENLVKRYTGLTDEQYRMTIFEAGIDFLHHMEGKHEEEYFVKLSKQKGFWNWWSNKWFSRDNLFANTVLFSHQHLKEGAMYNVYLRWHSLPKIVQKNDIESSYYRMLHTIEFNKHKA